MNIRNGNTYKSSDSEIHYETKVEKINSNQFEASFKVGDRIVVIGVFDDEHSAHIQTLIGVRKFFSEQTYLFGRP